MAIENLTIGELSGLLGMSAKSRQREFAGGKFRIVVLQRGWVAVGTLYEGENEFRLENAKVIRIWGTTKGLGELAMGGPTSKTVLDDSGTLRFHPLSVVMTLDAEEEQWTAKR